MERNKLMDDLRNMHALLAPGTRKASIVSAAIGELDSDVMQVVRLQAQLNEAGKLWHEQQRKLNHALYEVKGYRCAAEDEKLRGNFFLRQLRKFGYNKIDPGGPQPSVVSRDPLHPDFVSGKLPSHIQAACPHGYLDDTCPDCVIPEHHDANFHVPVSRDTNPKTCAHGHPWNDCAVCKAKVLGN